MVPPPPSEDARTSSPSFSFFSTHTHLLNRANVCVFLFNRAHLFLYSHVDCLLFLCVFAKYAKWWLFTRSEGGQKKKELFYLGAQWSIVKCVRVVWCVQLWQVEHRDDNRVWLLFSVVSVCLSRGNRSLESHTFSLFLQPQPVAAFLRPSPLAHHCLAFWRARWAVQL